MRTLKIGLLGFGNIGSGLYSLLRRKRVMIAEKEGVSLDIVRIGDQRKKFRVPVDKHLLTTDLCSIVRDPEIDVIVELIGGIRPAYDFVIEALKCGKDVVTANKALLAEKGNEIFRAAERYERQIFFEASVGGGIPVIQGIREGLAANRIQSIHSIINGTCNYILTEMTDRHLDFSQALKQAQEKGFAEANPALDIEGIDAAHKITILASLAFGKMASFRDVHVEGISQIRSEDIAFAEEFGYRIKLLAIAKATAGGAEVRVQPTLLPKGHLLSNVNGSFNAILIRADETEDVLFYGRGAGAKPTSSAIVSDLIELSKIRAEMETPFSNFPKGELKIKKISDILSRYYLRFRVIDRPGVLAKISALLGKCGISISDVIQKERCDGSAVPLILLTHDVREDALRRAVRVIDHLPVIRGKTQVLRIES